LPDVAAATDDAHGVFNGNRDAERERFDARLGTGTPAVSILQ